MPSKTVLIDTKSGGALCTEKYAGEVLLSTTTPQKIHGIFKTASYTVQGTFEQIAPKGYGSLELTDLIVTFEKKNLAVITINFHDGTNTVPLFSATLTDAPCNIAVSFTGNWQGWQSAHIDVIISGADAIGTVALGFIHQKKAHSLTYSEWNARR